MMGSKMASASRVVQDLTRLPRLVLNLELSCLSNSRVAVITHLHHQAQQERSFLTWKTSMLFFKEREPISAFSQSNRMMAVVKPHTPLIRFPDRRDNPKLSASEVLGSAGLPSHSSMISQHSKGAASPDLLMNQGPPDTAEMIKTLPQKYRRKPISQEEMEFIQRGGPE